MDKVKNIFDEIDETYFGGEFSNMIKEYRKKWSNLTGEQLRYYDVMRFVEIKCDKSTRTNAGYFRDIGYTMIIGINLEYFENMTDYPVYFGGIQCDSSDEALFHTIAHEMIHLYQYLNGKNRGHDLEFQIIAQKYFGHKNYTHNFPSVFTKPPYKPGQPIATSCGPAKVFKINRKKKYIKVWKNKNNTWNFDYSIYENVKTENIKAIDLIS